MNYKISNISRTIKMLFLIIPFFRPEFISLMYGDSILNMLFNGWRVLAFLIIAFLYVKKEFKIEKEIVLIILFELVCLFSSYKNGISLSSRIVTMSNFLGIIMFFKYYSKAAPQNLIKVVYGYFSFLIIINAISTLIWPNGLNNSLYDSGRINFLGKDNTITLFYLLAIACGILYTKVKQNTKLTKCIFSIIVLSTFYYFSASGIVAITIVTIYILVFADRISSRIFINPYTVLTFYVVLEILFVFVQRVDAFANIFGLLGKNTTFTNRIYYWNAAISQIKSSPIYGVGSGIVDIWGGDYYSHNAILDILMKGGIIALILWFILIAYIIRKPIRNKPNLNKTMLIILLAFLFIGLVEGLEDRIAFCAFLSIFSILKDNGSRLILTDYVKKIKKVKFSIGGKHAC